MHKRWLFIILLAAIFLVAACQSYPVGSRVEGEAALLQKLDLNGNGEIDNDDFFALSNAFGKKRGEEGYDAGFDFDNDGVIGDSDFFLLTENFGKKYDKGASAALIGDFNGDGCVSQADIDKADADVAALQQRYDAGEIQAAAFANLLKKYNLNKDDAFWSEQDKDVLRGRFGEGCNVEGDLGSIDGFGDEAAKPAALLDCSTFEGADKDACWEMVASDVNNLDAAACGNIEDATLREYCEEKVCLFVGNCPKRAIQAFHFDGTEFSSEEYAALEQMDDAVVLGKGMTFVIQAPEQAGVAKMDFRFEHPLSVKPSIGYLRGDTSELKQAAPEEFYPSVSIGVQGQGEGEYVNYDAYLKDLNVGVPVIDGKVTFKITPQNRIYTAAATGLRTSDTDTFVLNQLFKKISFARDENALGYGQFIAVMDSSGKLQAA